MRGRIALQTLGLALVLGVVYAKALGGGFIWDDVTYLVGSPTLTLPGGLWRLWSDRSLPDFWPVTNSVLWLEYQSFGLAVVGYHSVNLVLHLVNAVLVWRLLERLGARFAYAAACIFALHPVNVEAVAWIIQVKTLLSSSLALGSLVLCLDGRRSRYGAAALLFLLAMGAKAAVVTWPAAVAICMLIGDHRAFSGAHARRNLLRLATLAAIAAAMGGLNLWWYSGHGPEAPAELIRDDDWVSHLLIGVRALWFYLGKALWPQSLAFVYPRWQTGGLTWQAAAALIATLLAAVSLWHWRRKAWGRVLGLAAAYYAVTLLPVLGVFDIYFMRYSFVADHWQYLSLIAPCVLVSEAVGRATPRLRLIMFGAAALTLAGLSFKQAGIYENEETVWRDSLNKNPGSWMAHNSLGLLFNSRGDKADALQEYAAALAIKPQAQSYYNIGLIYDQMGRLDEALLQYRKASELNPYYHIVWGNMGAVLAKLGNQEAAKAAFETALQLAPTAVNEYNLGFLLEAMGDKGAARLHLEQAVALDPRSELFRATLARMQR